MHVAGVEVALAFNVSADIIAVGSMSVELKEEVAQDVGSSRVALGVGVASELGKGKVVVMVETMWVVW